MLHCINDCQKCSHRSPDTIIYDGNVHDVNLLTVTHDIDILILAFGFNLRLIENTVINYIDSEFDGTIFIESIFCVQKI